LDYFPKFYPFSFKIKKYIINNNSKKTDILKKKNKLRRISNIQKNQVAILDGIRSLVVPYYTKK
jgi:hypothetical protein